MNLGPPGAMIEPETGKTENPMIERKLLLALLLGLAPLPAMPQDKADAPSAPRISLSIPDAERGHRLFVNKGCVICHSINGVGGKAGPALDAAEVGAPVAPINFAARMWRGAVAMAVLQSMELGYQIELTGDEIADLAAFAASRSEQALLTESDIPEIMRGFTVDEPLPSIESLEAPAEGN